VVVLVVAIVVGAVEHVESPVRQFDDPATVDQTVAALESAVTLEFAAVQVLQTLQTITRRPCQHTAQISSAESH